MRTDLFSWDGKNYIVVTYYFSNYFEVKCLTTMNSRSVIVGLKDICARHGVPDVLIIDNGPQYAKADFTEFAKNLEFLHTTSGPHYPKSNGLAESSVKIVQNILRKSLDRGEYFMKNLLIYRTTPLQIGMSPAELLMNRKLWSNLPINGD